MIYKTDDVYVISSRHQWLPGNYDTERTARWAFQFPEAVLYDLQTRVNQDEQRPITRDDLRAAKSWRS